MVEHRITIEEWDDEVGRRWHTANCSCMWRDPWPTVNRSAAEQRATAHQEGNGESSPADL
jgi:hypothetical protein